MPGLFCRRIIFYGLGMADFFTWFSITILSTDQTNACHPGRSLPATRSPSDKGDITGRIVKYTDNMDAQASGNEIEKFQV
jgi:hypothetical protein